MPLDAAKSDFGGEQVKHASAATAYPLIEKAIAKVDSGDLPPYYATDLQVFRRVLADIVGLPILDGAGLAPLKANFAEALERSTWFCNAELVKFNRTTSGQDVTLDKATETELDQNLKFLLRNGLPGLFKGIDGNLYHNYSHCWYMSQRTLAYTREFGLQFSQAESQALRIGLVGHDGAHSGVLGPPDLEHNVQYAVKMLYLFMDYYGFSRRQIGFAIEKGVLPTVSFNSEFVPQDAIGVAAELGDLAFEIELPHFLTNSLNVLNEQIPSIIQPPDTITQWLRQSVRDGFVGTYLHTRVSELSKIPGANADTFRRLTKWMGRVQSEVTILADCEERNQSLPRKFQFFTPIKEQALATMAAQKETITASATTLPGPRIIQRRRTSLLSALERGVIPHGSSRLRRQFFS